MSASKLSRPRWPIAVCLGAVLGGCGFLGLYQDQCPTPELPPPEQPLPPIRLALHYLEHTQLSADQSLPQQVDYAGNWPQCFTFQPGGPYIRDISPFMVTFIHHALTLITPHRQQALGLSDADLQAAQSMRRAAVSLLFTLLNEMDGMAEDADVLFLLTTNRPDLLEPALAARPGRVDQAVELPLPDELCRRRLFELYSRGLTLRVASLQRFVARTEGASAAFIRELMRKAALFALQDTGELVVEDGHVEEALDEMVVQGGNLTRKLLGFPKVEP